MRACLCACVWVCVCVCVYVCCLYVPAQSQVREGVAEDEDLDRLSTASGTEGNGKEVREGESERES